MSVVIDLIIKYRAHKSSIYEAPIAIKPLVFVRDPAPQPLEDTLYVVMMGSHFYVAFYDHTKKRGYIADSLDIVMHDAETVSRLYKYLLIDYLRPLHFSGVLRIDFCGAGAVAIGLEFIRMFKKGEFNLRNSVDVPHKFLKRIVRQVHGQSSSASLERWKSIANIERLECAYCARKFWKRRARFMHERFCRRFTSLN